MSEITDKPLMAYPNDIVELKPDIAPSKGEVGSKKNTNAEEYGEWVQQMLKVKSLRVIGGCCGVYPSKIKLIRSILDSN